MLWVSASLLHNTLKSDTVWERMPSLYFVHVVSVVQGEWEQRGKMSLVIPIQTVPDNSCECCTRRIVTEQNYRLLYLHRLSSITVLVSYRYHARTA